MQYIQPKVVMEEYQDPKDHRQKQLKDFLQKISMLESSGGQNTNHRTIASGPQAGDTAIGNYGLMPNSMEELSHIYPSDITNGMSKDELADKARQDPAFAETMAGSMADYLKNKRGFSDEQAAAAWEAGHHSAPENLNLNSPRAKRFRVLQRNGQ